MSEFVGKSIYLKKTLIYLRKYKAGYAAALYNKKRGNLLPIDCLSFFSSLAQYTHKLSHHASKYQAPYVPHAHRLEQGGRS